MNNGPANESVETLRTALADLKRSAEELKKNQRESIETEKAKALSIFAAQVAHKIRNPLQTLVLGLDYLSGHIDANDPNLMMVLGEMTEAVQKANAIIGGLVESVSIPNFTVAQPTPVTENPKANPR